MTIHRLLPSVTVSTLLFLSVVPSVSSAPVQVVDCGAVLTVPGRYRLASDLSCTTPPAAIVILGSDIQLDFAGYGITCLGVFGNGVNVSQSLNVKITNGFISGCLNGIVLVETQDSQVTEMTLIGNTGAGIALSRADDNIVSGNWANENGRQGIILVGANGNRVSGNVTNDNTRAGLGISSLGDPSSDNRLIGNESNRNGTAGIFLLGMASDNIVRGNVTNYNLRRGIVLVGRETEEGVVIAPIAGPDNIVQGNTALGNNETDLFEAAVDPFTLEIVRIAEDCANIWKSNTFVSRLGPEPCIE